jgi:hypothetical protein
LEQHYLVDLLAAVIVALAAILMTGGGLSESKEPLRPPAAEFRKGIGEMQPTRLPLVTSDFQ